MVCSREVGMRAHYSCVCHGGSRPAVSAWASLPTLHSAGKHARPTVRDTLILSAVGSIDMLLDEEVREECDLLVEPLSHHTATNLVIDLDIEIYFDRFLGRLHLYGRGAPKQVERGSNRQYKLAMHAMASDCYSDVILTYILTLNRGAG